MAIRIVNRAPEAAYLIDEQGRFRFVNDETCRFSGYTRNELLGLRVSDVDQDLPPQAWPNFWSEIARQRSLSYESWHRTKSGEVFPVEVAVIYFEYDGRGFALNFLSDSAAGRRDEVVRTAIHDIGNVLN